MDADHQEYGFLDLTDINEEERTSLTSALFATNTAPVTRWPNEVNKPENQVAWTDPPYDLSSCSSDTAGPPTASSSLDSLSTTEREMAPTHSPQRGSQNHHMPPVPCPPNNPPAALPPPVYSQPPPPVYAAPPPHGPQHHWPHMIPPNVYVSQVTANVNVHGWGQYYQPQQYVPVAHSEPRGRDGRRGRRNGPNKRNSSPPPQQHQYMQTYYPTQYYPAAQTAQGAPLYQVPLYSQLGYVAGYPYGPYLEYPVMEEPIQQEKNPEEYPPEIMMEHEHVQHDMYYPQHACLQQPTMYDLTRPMDPGCQIEPYSQYYALQPPPSHQFNIHAKNFVRQNEHKMINYGVIEIPPEVNQAKPINLTNNTSIEILPIADLKISSAKPSSNPKNIPDKNSSTSQFQNKTPIILNNDKVVPKTLTETPKVAWINDQKQPEVAPSTAPAIVENNLIPVPVTTATPNVPITNVVNKPLLPPPAPSNAIPLKINKTPVSVPFTPIKSTVKTGVILHAPNLPSKAPFPNRQKKETSPKPTDANNIEPVVETSHGTPTMNIETKPATASPVIKSSNVSLAPALATTKVQFNQHKKPVTQTVESTPKPVSQPTPSASDFPPVPVPRRSANLENAPNSMEKQFVMTQSTPPTPSPVKSWASLLKENSTHNATSAVEELTLNNSASMPTLPVNSHNHANQKPVAKVGPFDSSLLPQEQASVENNKSIASMSYSEKTTNLGNQNAKIVNSRPETTAPKEQEPISQINPSSFRAGEFLLKHQLNHHILSVQPRGLTNRSNYCYINSILQALLACPPFFNLLRHIPQRQKRGKSNTPVMDAMIELVNEFILLQPGARITRAERSARASAANNVDSNDSTPGIIVNAGPSFEPSGVLKALRDIHHGDSFRVEGRQEDAEEFLGCLLNGLNDEMLELMKLVEPEDPKDNIVLQNGNCDNSVDHPDEDVEWKVMGPKNKGAVERRCLAGRTPLSDIFRGQLRSRLQKGTDSNTTDTTHCVQPFFTLPLDIERSSSVADALERVAGKDRLEGVTCPSRGRLVEAWQQSLIEQLPAALILHLKCFHCRASDGATAKILKTIEYPMDLKIDSKIMSTKMKYNQKQKCYKLFAVVYHEGSEAEKGHYLTDVYHAGCGGWLRYDDSVVTAVTENQVLHPRLPRMPYLLLYRRQDTIQAGQRFPQ